MNVTFSAFPAFKKPVVSAQGKSVTPHRQAATLPQPTFGKTGLYTDHYSPTQPHTIQYHMGLKFGARPLYKGAYDGVTFITDYGNGRADESSNTLVKNYFRPTVNFVQDPYHRIGLEVEGFEYKDWAQKDQLQQTTPGILEEDSISDLYGGNKDMGSLWLLRLLASFDQPQNNIVVHVVDPGVGADQGESGLVHDRTILVSEKHGIWVGPNNGSLGHITQQIKAKGDTCQLLEIDFDQVEKLERLRKNDPNYKVPTIFHGRDVFAVVAGAIAGGIDPSSLAVKNADGRLKQVDVIKREFSKPQTFDSLANETRPELMAVKDKTFGNLKTNIVLTFDELDTLVKANAFLTVTDPSDRVIDIPFKHKFNQVEPGEPVAYLGSTYSVVPGKQHLEIALNLDNAAERFGISERESSTLKLDPKNLEIITELIH